MSSRRTAKVAQMVREVVSTTVLFELRDPRIKNVTVTSVEVSSDLRNAKVFVSVMGDEKAKRLTMHGLNSARGHIQSKIGDRMKTRYTPLLKFVVDEGVKKSFEAARILKEVLPDVYANADDQSVAAADSNPNSDEASSSQTAPSDLGEHDLAPPGDITPQVSNTAETPQAPGSHSIDNSSETDNSDSVTGDAVEQAEPNRPA